MLNQTIGSEDAELCKRIMAVVSAVYQPVTLGEPMVLSWDCDPELLDLSVTREPAEASFISFHIIPSYVIVESLS